MSKKKKKKKKSSTLGLLEEIGATTPTFSPPISLAQGENKYEGILTFHPQVQFRVSVNRQHKGFYAVRGTVALISPVDGYLLQPSADKMATIMSDRHKKGAKEITSQHAFATAAKKELHIPRKTPPLGVDASADASGNKYEISSVDYTDAVALEALRLANKLIIEYEKDIRKRLSTDVPIDKMPLALLLSLHGAAYLDTRTDSDTQKAAYRRDINVVASAAGVIPIRDLTQKKLSELVSTYPNITVQRLQEVQKFLRYVSLYRHSADPFSTVIDSVIENYPRERNIPALRDKATLPPCLTEEVDEKIDSSHRNKFDPLAAGLILIKEGHLSAEDVCQATFGMIDFSANNPFRVFVLLRKDNYSGATHDYGFPLFSFGADYLTRYMNYLKETYGEIRIESNKYILSYAEDGSVPIDTNELLKYCKKEVDKFPFGYAALAKISVSREPKVITLFHNTYKKRLAEDCRLKNDYGALLFLTHQSFSHSVQADCYRSFTDSTGREYLFRSTQRDRRGIPPQPIEQKHYRVRSGKAPQTKVKQYAPNTYGFANTIRVSMKGLKPGDTIEVETARGCFLSTLHPE